jgi:hypothetical protein
MISLKTLFVGGIGHYSLRALFDFNVIDLVWMPNFDTVMGYGWMYPCLMASSSSMKES